MYQLESSTDINEEQQYQMGRAGLKIPQMPAIDRYSRVVHEFLEDVYYTNFPEERVTDGEFSIPGETGRPLVLIRKETYRDDKQSLDERRTEALRRQTLDEFAPLANDWRNPEYEVGYTAYEIVIPSVKKIAKPLIFLRSELSDNAGHMATKPYWAKLTYRGNPAEKLEDRYPDSTQLNRFILRQTVKLLK